MTKQEFAAAVFAYLAEQTPDLDSSLLTPDANLWDLGYVDSIRVVELVVFIENLIGREIDLSANDAKPAVSVGEMYEAYVKAG